jgi:hypothetical protein
MTSENGEFAVTPTEPKTTGTAGNFSHGSRETPATSASPMESDRSEKARSHKSDMHVAGESDRLIVPKKPANKGGVPPPAESVEGRGLTEENTGQSLLDRTQRRNAGGKPFVPRSRGLLGVREAAQRDKKCRFNNLLHHLTPELLRASFFELKKQASPGVDGETWRDYAKDFERRIDNLRESIAVRIEPSLPSGRTSLNWMANYGRWESPRWRTKSSSKRCARFWNASTNRTSWGSATVFVLDEASTEPWMHCTWGSRSGK